MNVAFGNSVEDDNGNHQTNCQVRQDAWGERRNTEEVLRYRASANHNGNAYNKKRNAELGERQRDSSEQRKTNYTKDRFFDLVVRLMGGKSTYSSSADIND